MMEAIIKDRAKDYVNAVVCYEQEIQTNKDSSPVELYINLAFLYWEFAFEKFEFNIPNKIPGSLSILGGNRYQHIIDEGLSRFPNNLELHFWNKYFKHISYGEDF